MFVWNPDLMAMAGGALMLLAFAVLVGLDRVRRRRKKREAEANTPEEQFRTMIETFNRLDQSVTADSIGTMRTARRPRR
ncbi:hypothetical protein [Minwuia sp.]|uniref:hypothetical protein n=1 Tax=Minwuia sp. TaxID=2493630 RepID=UPI003A934FEB